MKGHFRLWAITMGCALLAACGGEDGAPASGQGPTPTPTTSPSPTPTPAQACAASASTNAAYSCTPATTLAGSVSWSLENAPEGMRIHPVGGVLKWTPTAAQTGAYHFTVVATAGGMREEFAQDLSVAAGAPDPAGIYVSPAGDDGNTGAADAPLKTLRAAAAKVGAGDTIFLRGGEYRNDDFGQPYAGRTQGSLVRFTVSGTANAPITLRNFGNELAKLKTDVTGIAFKDAAHWVIQGFEIEGNAANLNEDIIMNQWWNQDSKQVDGRGITGSYNHVTISDMVIHDFPGAGIANSTGEFLTVERNIVFDNAAWSTAGVHGITLSNLSSTGPANTFSIQVRENLVFGNQSLVISHVFSKGFVTLAVDEGYGIHLQDTTDSFDKAALVEHNLSLLNGKAGIGINTIDNVTVRRNSVYQNSRVVADTGEFVSQTSNSKTVEDNLFHPREDRRTFRVLPANDPSGFGANATLSGIAGDTQLPPQTLSFAAVFTNPGALDFTPASGVPTGMGAATSAVSGLLARAREFGVVIDAPTQPFNAQIEQAQRVRIFASWPPEWAHIILKDKASGHDWTYAQRCHYPTWPAAADC